MLLRVLKQAYSTLLDRRAETSVSQIRSPVEVHEWASKNNARLPMDLHLEILYGNAKWSSVNFLELYNSCLQDSKTRVPVWKFIIRAQSAFYLARYFLYSLGIEGAKAECGVSGGFSSLLVCRAASLTQNNFTGEGLHFIDSYEGLPESTYEDFVPIRSEEDGKYIEGPAFRAGAMRGPLEHVRSVLHAYPGVRLHKGYIPEVLAVLPETSWSFVHIDVDLYEPTLSCLEYFYSRVTTGGVIICDDYGSILFPGAHKAWDKFCARHDIPFLVLPTGQSVIIRGV